MQWFCDLSKISTMKKLLLILVWVSLISCSSKDEHTTSSPEFTTATIEGNLTLLSGNEIILEGFNGLNTYKISTTTIDDKGNFKLSYSIKDYGVGFLQSTDGQPLFVILSGEDIFIEGEALSSTATIRVIKGQENQWFEQYAKEQPKREQALSAWDYLEKIYKENPLFSNHIVPKEAIQTEKQRIKAEDAAFLANLPQDSYVQWYLPIRKLVSSVSTIAQYRTEELPETIQAFRNLDYTDSRLYKSGLFKEAIESHFWLLENSGKSLDSVFMEMQRSMDAMMVHLFKDEQKLNEVTDYLFNLLERHSLFQASEYLALKVLNQTSCNIDNDLAKQLESYRAMKNGNLAPDIVFAKDHFAPGYASNIPQKLSEIKSNYTAVVFGSSWCPKCTEELPEIAHLYPKWKGQGVEVLFVSLDEEKELFQGFVKDFPFISTCDYRKWDSDIVNDYYVFATPTMYLLDTDRRIVLRPNSVKQMDAWVEWVLVQGNN
jgi:thiol-disulfide isomerase/thioredoxin